jgi:capsule biosynthesis phosphatase
MIFKVIENLNISSNDELIIIYNKNLEQFNFESILSNKTNIKINFFQLQKATKGAAETISEYLKNIDSDEPILILDCDTIYHEDVISKCRETKESKIFYFIDKQKDPIYSYIKVSKNGLVKEIKEKIKISNNANTGAYFFKSINELKKYISILIKDYHNNELYTSLIFNLMLKDEIKIESEEIKNFYCVGTPFQLQKYCATHYEGEKKRFVFDLDNTLVSFPEKKSDYSTVKPIEKNIKYVNFLKNLGHHIIIYTARKMKTFNGDVKLVENNIRNLTEDTLKKFNVQYDELIFGKPYADFYIDDLAVSSFEDFEKKTGFYNFKIEARSFHKMEIQNDIAIKYGHLNGEFYWYITVPQNILKYTPKIFELSENHIKMEKINGVPLSFLNTNNLLTKKEFNQLFFIMNDIHKNKFNKKLNIKKFYIDKLKERYQNRLYKQLKNSNEYYNYFMKHLKNIEIKHISIIHGDPVFTNILYTIENKMILIDPRGLIGNEKCIYGDIFYDYAKIYQSICGYDHILLNKPFDIKNINKNKKIFKEYFLKDFSIKEFKYVKFLKNYLIYTMLPLHKEFDKIQKYYDLIDI